MDSLLANYASSDEEEENSQQGILLSSPPNPQGQVKDDSISKSSGFLSSLPPPKSSLFFSLSPPKSHTPISVSVSSERQKLSEEAGPKSLQNLDDSNLSTSLPKPSSSLFSSLPEPKSSSSSSLFSFLPPPKTHNADPQVPSHSSSVSSGPAGKKVIQFRPPPMNPSTHVGNEDEDEDDEGEKEKQKKKSESMLETSSVKSFLSSIPAPKNSLTLGALPSASGSGRRSILEADVPASNDLRVVSAGNTSETGFDANLGHYGGHLASGSWENAGSGDYSNWSSGPDHHISSDGYTGYGTSVGGSDDYQNSSGGNVDYANYSSDYGSYASHGQYSSNWANESTATVVPQLSGLTESALRVSGKRGRNDAPQEIIEVKQDELMKNRPREDQVKLTGIAFGPSYQPASTKGKPSKLHKRKHQIGSLYFDMKQKETELAERRSKGFLTKAQTQGKYGW